jgi:hypothetical protein
VRLGYVEEIVAFRHGELVFLAFLVEEGYVEPASRVFVNAGVELLGKDFPQENSLFARFWGIDVAV